MPKIKSLAVLTALSLFLVVGARAQEAASLMSKFDKIDPKILDAYVGQYELNPNFIITMTREGDRLMTQVTGQPKFELFPESETKFFLKVVDAQVTFVKDDKGAVTHLILHQGGDQKAMKIK